MRILLFTRSLGVGGAERQLLLLARELRSRHDVRVLTFYGDESPLTAEPWLRPMWESLDKRHRWDTLPFLIRFLRALRRWQPDLVYAFTGPPSLVALCARLRRHRPAIVWGVRSSNVDMSRYDSLAPWIRRAECRLSGWADGIIANSHAGREQALLDGFANTRIEVIGNGIDTSLFKPARTEGAALRSRLGIPPDAPVIGTIARLDPMKGYEVLLDAAALLHSRLPQVHWVLGGGGEAAYVRDLHERGEALGLAARVHWIGPVSEVPATHSAFDLFTSTSVFGEGFSNSVGEAMACGLPCVVTDVGDAARIVGDTGRVVAANDPAALAQAWHDLVERPAAERRQIGALALQRVHSAFSVKAMVDRTEQTMQEILRRCESRS